MKNFTNWKTTIIGLVTVIISILVGTGVITPDQLLTVSDHSVSVVEAVFMAITGVSGLISIFLAKDKIK